MTLARTDRAAAADGSHRVVIFCGTADLRPAGGDIGGGDGAAWLGAGRGAAHHSTASLHRMLCGSIPGAAPDHTIVLDATREWVDDEPGAFLMDHGVLGRWSTEGSSVLGWLGRGIHAAVRGRGGCAPAEFIMAQWSDKRQGREGREAGALSPMAQCHTLHLRLHWVSTVHGAGTGEGGTCLHCALVCGIALLRPPKPGSQNTPSLVSGAGTGCCRACGAEPWSSWPSSPSTTSGSRRLRWPSRRAARRPCTPPPSGPGDVGASAE